MVHEHRAHESTPDEASDGRAHSSDGESEQSGGDHPGQEADAEDEPVLEPNHPVLLQVAHIGVVWFTLMLVHQDPEEMAPPESARCIVRIRLMVDLLVMTTMVARPLEDGILERARAEHRVGEAEGAAGVVAAVREQPMVADRDRKPAGEIPDEEDHPLDPSDPVRESMPDGTDEGERWRPQEERRVEPVDVEWLGWSFDVLHGRAPLLALYHSSCLSGSR